MMAGMDIERYLVQWRYHGDEWKTIRLIGDHSEGLTLEEAQQRAERPQRAADVRIVPVTSYTVEVDPDPRENVWIWGNRGGKARRIGRALPD